MSDSARLLGIVGSPRRGGNTDRLMDGILHAASDRGASTAKLLLSDFDIRPCRGCLSCYPGGRERCAVHDDDVSEIFRRMSAADVWILGTPVYCYGPVGSVKVFLDRWISMLPAVRQETRGAALIPLHASAAGAAVTLDMLTTLFRGFGILYAGELICPGLLHREDLDRHPEYMGLAAEFGVSLASTLPSPPSQRTPVNGTTSPGRAMPS